MPAHCDGSMAKARRPPHPSSRPRESSQPSRRASRRGDEPPSLQDARSSSWPLPLAVRSPRGTRRRPRCRTNPSTLTRSRRTSRRRSLKCPATATPAAVRCWTSDIKRRDARSAPKMDSRGACESHHEQLDRRRPPRIPMRERCSGFFSQRLAPAGWPNTIHGRPGTFVQCPVLGPLFGLSSYSAAIGNP